MAGVPLGIARRALDEFTGFAPAKFRPPGPGPIAEDGETRFMWNSTGYSSLAAFASTPVEQGGAYISTAQRDQILSAKGVPLAP